MKKDGKCIMNVKNVTGILTRGGGRYAIVKVKMKFSEIDRNSCIENLIGMKRGRIRWTVKKSQDYVSWLIRKSIVN